MQSDEIDKIIPALIKAKAEFGPVLKEATNPAFRSKYANLGSVLDAVAPALYANGLLLIQPTRVQHLQGEHAMTLRMVLTTYLWHDSGQYICSEWVLNPTAETPQSEGSALTYGRRYSALTMLGIAPEDDDGNAASQQRAGSSTTQQDKPDWMVLLAEANSVAQVEDIGRRANQMGDWGKIETVAIARRAELLALETVAEPTVEGVAEAMGATVEGDEKAAAAGAEK